MEQHSKQISKQSDEPQQFSIIPQSNTAWHASSVQAASPAASTQQQQQPPAAASQHPAPPIPHTRQSPTAEHMDSSSQKRQARRQWAQQSVKTTDWTGSQVTSHWGDQLAVTFFLKTATFSFKWPLILLLCSTFSFLNSSRVAVPDGRLSLILVLPEVSSS